MQAGSLHITALAAAFTLAALAAASGCSDGANDASARPRPSPSAAAPPDAGAPEPTPDALDRKVDYGEALRVAALKLVGELPALAEIRALSAAESDAAKQSVYEATVDAYLKDPRFVGQMITWWRNTLKTGQQGRPRGGGPDLDSAALFAAQVVVSDRPYTDLFTATKGTCPKLEGSALTSADCPGTQPVAGLLSDPGLMAQYYGPMAFRRVRFVQETFACAKFPAEYGPAPTPMGTSIYTSPWKFDSITGGAKAKINFLDTSSVICANCHTTVNHLAPLFANFDQNGAYSATEIQVKTPVVPPTRTERADWLPEGEKLAWRSGAEVQDLPSLGLAMAKDPEVGRCLVSRAWNWAFSRGDIVNDLASVPNAVTADILAEFNGNGMKVRPLLRAIFTSPDFIRF